MQSLIQNFHLQAFLFFSALAVFIWYAFAIIYHFIRFGIGTMPKILALVFFIGSFLLFSASVITYLKINWSELVQIVINYLKI